MSDKRYFTFQLPKNVYYQLRKMSFESEIPMSDYARTGIDLVIEAEKKKISKVKIAKK